MKPSILIEKIKQHIKNYGDRDIYLLSKVDGDGTHVGRIVEVSADAEDNIILETDIDAESVTTNSKFVKLDGKVLEAEYVYKRFVYVKPIAHHYEAQGEKPYIKYCCPVCEALDNKHQVIHGTERCPLCNVNFTWDN